MSLRRRIVACFLALAIAGVVAGDADGPTFDVAPIKPSGSDDHFSAFRGFHRGTFMANNVPLRQVLAGAYGVSQPREIGPDWLNNDRFDFMAKAAEDVPDSQLKPMPQALLKERFQLSANMEQREIPVFYLNVAKGGVKMPVYPARDNGPVTPGDYPRSAMMRGQYTSAEFAGAIGPPSGPPPEFEAPDFFSAIQQQLGLKLEVAKDNVGVVVVDHMERTATEK